LGDSDVSIVGGKGLNLCNMISSGLPVPAFVVVPVAAYRIQLAEVGVNVGDPVPVGGLGRIKDALASLSLPTALTVAMGSFLQTLPPGAAVSCRSSATVEDAAQASFAGQFETRLNCIGLEDVVDGVKACWCSAWEEHIYQYQQQRDNTSVPAIIDMAVVIQQQLDCGSAGVMFTCNTVTGSLDEFTVEAVFGQGEGLVSGAISPDRYFLRAADGTVLHKQVGIKSSELRLSANNEEGFEQRAVTGSRQYEPALNNEQLVQLVQLGRDLQRLYGYDGDGAIRSASMAQDVEFGVVGDTVFLLQTRPVTSIRLRLDTDREQVRRCTHPPMHTLHSYTTSSSRGLPCRRSTRHRF
jgi:pyruvate,water dikinase